ncbi:MAG: hypothetical protein R8L53_04120 [Mariprofundales bacterium]
MLTFNRITLLSIMFIIIYSGAFVMLICWIIHEHEMVEIQQDTLLEIDRKSDMLLSSIYSINDDALFLASLARYSGLGEQSDDWREALNENYYAYMQEHHEILKIRLIAIEDGQELLRINHFTNEIKFVLPQDLQQKSLRPYFQIAKELNHGEVYFSPINLNHDFGKVSLPKTPIIRVLTPIVIKNRKIALISISMRMQPLLNTLTKKSLINGQIYLFDNKGDLLFSSDMNKMFAFDFSQRQQLQQRFASLDYLLRDDAPLSGNVELGNGLNGSYGKLFLYPSHTDNFLLLLKSYSVSTHAIEELELPFIYQAIIAYLFWILLTVILSMYIVKKLLRPWYDLQALIKALAKDESCSTQALTDALQKKQYEEINVTINVLLVICDRQHKYQNILQQKETQLLHMQRMEKMNVQRELQMIALKQEVNSLHHELYGSDKYAIKHSTDLTAQQSECGASTTIISNNAIYSNEEDDHA